MIVGMIEMPNKWAMTARVTGTPFIYTNTPSFPNSNEDTWGDTILVSESVRLYKIIAQSGYRVTEYWCVQLDKLPQAIPSTNDCLLFPVAMKRFGYRNSEAKFFIFQNPIFSLQYLIKDTARIFYPSQLMISEKNNWHSSMQKYSPAEYLFMALESSEPWPEYGAMLASLMNKGACTIRFPSGATISIHDVLSRCANVLNYSKAIIHQFDNCGTPHDIGITNESDVLMFLMDYTPCDPGNQFLDVDYIGEQIIANNISSFPIDCVGPLTMHSPSAINTLNMFRDASRREEIVEVENLSPVTLREAHLKLGSVVDNIQEDIDEIITCLYRDEATTMTLVYDYSSGKLNVLDRVIGYGYASMETCRGTQLFNTTDQISFSLHYLCEVIQANQIRLIKTYNEELFLTVWYDNGNVQSYYYNLIIHSIVTGALFTL